jgi:hypothetical protein
MRVVILDWARPSRFAARVTLRSCATVLKISNVVWFIFLFLI